jgi:LysM domain-containing protein
MRVGMVSRFLQLSAISLLLSAPLLAAATPANQEQEYQQVRKIAMRDPKVRAAYDDADRRLEEKIVRIDPALSSYTHRRPSEGTSVGPTVRPAAPTPKVHLKPAATSGKTHVIAKGETLTSIAAHYAISVAALKSANHNPDEKHLVVGQTLVIPGGKHL